MIQEKNVRLLNLKIAGTLVAYIYLQAKASFSYQGR